MTDIYEGVRKFQRSVHPRRREHFESLASDQRPGLMLITCSDSRIDPALLTQTAPGEIFVIRNAGNFVPPYDRGSGGEAATIEFGIEVLGIRQIVVCGHTQCGAMQAVRDPASAASLPAVSSWLAFGRPALDRAVDFGEDVDPLTESAAASVLVQIDHLRTHPSVSSAEARGELELRAWLYDFVSGELWVGSDRGEFRRLTDAVD